MTKDAIEYKGKKATIMMMGTKQAVPGWKGELFVAVIQYGEQEALAYDVVPDSTSPADLDFLPEVQTFTDRSLAIAHLMKLEHNKKLWK